MVSTQTALIVPTHAPPSFNKKLSLDPKYLLDTLNEIKRRDSSTTKDDTIIDYTSVLDQDDQRRRYSEKLVDADVKDSLELRKLYRQIQRQVHCNTQQVSLQLRR